MKKLLTFLLIIALMLPISVTSAASLHPDANIKVLLDGKKLSFDIDPVQTQGTTLVQFTTIFKALGLKYDWDQATKTINGYNEDLQLRLTLNDPIANVNGFNIKLNVAPIAYQGKTLVPLRFVSETTGMKVKWNATSKTITIDSDPNSELIEEPSTFYYLSGASAGDTPKDVETLMPQKPTHPYGKETYTYNNVDFLSYSSELNFNFIYNELSSVSYYIGKRGLDDNYFVVYGDIMEDLESTFGVPNEYSIYETSYEGYAGEQVDWDIPMQLLYEGIETGEYTIEAYWHLPHVVITLTLYTADDGTVLIEALFLPL